MKSISSALVVCAGIYGLTNATPLLSISHGAATAPVLSFAASIVVTVFGLIGWWASLKYDR